MKMALFALTVFGLGFTVCGAIFVSTLLATIWRDVRKARQLWHILPMLDGWERCGPCIEHKIMHIFWWVDEKGGHGQISKDRWLHAADFTYWSLYGWYWLRKYQRWFKELDKTLPPY